MKVIWRKAVLGEEASYGNKWGSLAFTWDLDDNKTGYAFLDSDRRIVTKKFKTKSAAKKAAEKWLKEKSK